MNETDKQTSIEALVRERDEAAERLRQARVMETQRKVLLPQLNARRDRLAAKIAPLQRQATDVEDARREIIGGEITDFRLRKPRAKKQTPVPVVAEDEQEK